MKKENDDLKYDNTLLYEKNVEKDKRMAKLTDENEILRKQLEQERVAITSGDLNLRKNLKRIQDLEDMLLVEQDRIKQRDKTMDELVNDREEMRSNLENDLSIQS